MNSDAEEMALHPSPSQATKVARFGLMQFQYDVDAAIMKASQANTLHKWTVREFRAVCRRCVGGMASLSTARNLACFGG